MGVESMAIPDWLTLLPGVQTNPRAGAVIPGTLDRIIGMLSVAAEELPDCPFYFQSDKLCSTIRTTVPKMSLLRSAFLNAGYRVSFSHAAQSSIKTDAPVSFVWDVICAWKRKYEVEVAANKVKDISADNQKQQEKFSPPTDGANGETKPDSKKKRGKPPKKHSRSEEFLCVMNALMAKPENPKVSFEEHPDANPPSRADGLVRYQQNPQPYWGPKARPSKKVIEEITPPTPKKLKSSE
nr:N2N2 dimethylguanosine tRNA methyltransferase [Hymenolepis microstoma]